MKVYVNERSLDVKNGTTLMQLKRQIKKDSDVVVYNGFIMKKDLSLKEEDNVVLLKRVKFLKKKIWKHS